MGSRRLTPNTWYYIECKVYIHDTNGTVDIQVNGISDLSLTNQDTKYSTSFTGASQIQLNLNAAVDLVFDDLYIADGTAGVNSFIGPCKIECLRPNGDDTTDWDPSTPGSHYSAQKISPALCVFRKRTSIRRAVSSRCDKIIKA